MLMGKWAIEAPALARISNNFIVNVRSWSQMWISRCFTLSQNFVSLYATSVNSNVTLIEVIIATLAFILTI